MSKLIVGWYGYGGHSWMAELLREDIMAENMELRTCHEYANAWTKYTPEGIFSFIDSCDVIILPARVGLEPAKSRNRLALAWSRGKACVVAPLPAYLSWVKNGENALVANGPSEFMEKLRILRDDAKLRETLGRNGKTVALSHMDPRQMVHRFLSAVTPKVSLIIPHYAPSLEYLKLAIESAKNQTGVDLEIIVSSSSSVHPGEVARGCKVHHQKERMTFSQAINTGLSMVRSDYTHVMIGNDDVIYSRNAIAKMLESLDGREDTVVNPFSNCDMGWLHHDKRTLKSGIKLHPGMTKEMLRAEDVEELMQPWEGKNELHYSPFCAFYSTLIPRKVLETVGILNGEYLNGGEDADFCYRAERLGFQCQWTESAYVFHFGGKTRKVSEDENKDRHHEEDRHNNNLLKRRWKAKRIAIYTGPAWEKWGLDAPEKGIGGSEYCAIRLAESFAMGGNEVSMFGDHARETVFTENGGVIEMYPWTSYKPKENYWDLFVASRSLASINGDLRAGKVVVWVHDIWILGTADIDPWFLSKVEKFIVLSPWHENFFIQHHKIQEAAKAKVTVIPNGSDTWRYTCDPGQKVYGKMMYSSSPDRGLDNLIYLMKFIRAEVPEAHLHVFYGFHNYDSAVRQRGNTDEIARLDKLKAQINEAEKEGLITMHGRVGMGELAEHWKSCYLYVYPTWFSETYCLTAKEAQASSTPSVTSDVGALQTTVGEFGVRVPGDPYSRDARIAFVNEAVRLLKDRDYWLEWSEKGYGGIKGCSWPEVFLKHWKPLLEK